MMDMYADTTVALHAVLVALRIKEIEQVSAEDSELQAVRNCLIEGKRDNAPKQYLPVRNELTFIGHVILHVWGTRINNYYCYTPSTLQESCQFGTRGTPGGS